ncbi:DUF934 domain-containing protein [Parvularcula lutaonensis]|uniref:DUF934 domain-containing protein n=1 Tax=Parvularcula lutaonensis TaxID=491923 RepID=A0ABV7M9K5_9PROT|nr:DUF934 domain-containing protein [Parvularcula lutaonensis]GGY46751.1 hypothetical protein GCM10007148_14850 [Parvularcula lutaonensis]
MPKLFRLADGAVIDVAPDADLAIPHDADLMAGAPDLSSARVVRIELPKFKDGRALTQARLLRQRHGYGGEIRAGGHVIPDQAQFLARLGVDTIEIPSETRVEDFRFALKAYRHAYQRPAQGQPAFAIRGARE